MQIPISNPTGNIGAKSPTMTVVPRNKQALIRISFPAFIVSPACEIRSCRRIDHDQCIIKR
jgi:hypothetical protein